MQFYKNEALMLGWFIIPLLIAIFIFAGKRKTKLLNLFGQTTTVSKLISFHAPHRFRIKATLVTLSVSMLILALAQPQWGEEKKQLKRKGIDLIFMVDTSLSMLARDVKPSRIEKAKFLMKTFIKHLSGDRVGIVTFAGSGFLQSPLTLDYSAFMLFANSIQVGYIPDPGTNLSDGIQKAVQSFVNDKQKSRAIVVISDGEATDGKIEDATQLAKKEQIRIYTIGTGTKEGEPIPLQSEDGKASGYKRNKQGEVVITKLNEEFLKTLAKETGGLYFQASPSENEVELIYEHLQSLGKKELKERVIIEREDHFQSFLIIGLLLLLFETLLRDGKQNGIKNILPI